MYEYRRETQLSYEETIKKVKEELKTEGFGIHTEIDVKTNLKEVAKAIEDKLKTVIDKI